MFYQVFFSPQVKRCTITIYQNSIYNLLHQLSNNIRLTTPRHFRRRGGKCPHKKKKRLTTPRHFRRWGGPIPPNTHTHTHTHTHTKKTREWVISRAITGPLRQRQAIHRHAIQSVRPEAAKRTKQYCIHNAIPDTLPNHEDIILNHEIYEQLPPLTIVFPRPNPIPEPFSQQLTQGHLTCAFIH